MKYDLNLSPTQYAFATSRVEVPVLIGPMGEGKTFAGAARLLHIGKQFRDQGIASKIKGAFIRDTGPNIEQHSIPSLIEGFGRISSVKNLRSGGWRWNAPNVEMIMFGLDSLTDLGRVQGPQWDFLWLEEPAPIIMAGSAGLREEVFDMGRARLRKADDESYRWAQVTMNPPEELHWSWQRYVKDPKAKEDGIQIFRIPGGENTHYSEADRRRLARAFRNRPDLARRYIAGEAGFVQEGEAVTPEYNPLYHRSKIPLDPLPYPEAMRWWDGWHHPTCLILQRAPSGRLFLLDSFRGDNIGMTQLIDGQVQPVLQAKYRHIKRWRDIGDETMCTPDQSNTEVTTAGIINGKLKASFEPCPNSWEPRRESVKNLLRMMIDAEPMLQVSCHEGIVHQALRGGWHYHMNQKGVTGAIPVKNIHSHPGDALTYGAVMLTPWVSPVRMPRTKGNRRALSYAV